MAKQAAASNVTPSFEQRETTALSEEVSRPTEELVIGMVGAVGAGATRTASVLKETLEKDFGYNVQIVRASEIIKDNASKTDIPNPSTSGANRIQGLQKIGTSLRAKFGPDYIAAKAVELIALKRRLQGGYDEGAQVPQPKTLRNATIIDSLKHPKEVDLLKRVYGGIYWQFTVFAPEKIREIRLNSLGVEKAALSGIFTRDEDDSEDHGQKVSKTAFKSDFFIRNDGENDDRLNKVINRFLEIVFNICVHTPTNDEAGMYAAVSAASKSACISRQVGAAIYSKQGELVSVGWNDVPRANGGLYSQEDESGDHRCYKWGEKICHNDKKKEELYDKIFDQLNSHGLLVEDATNSKLRSVLKSTPVKSLIEYSRSIHAEMEAIVSAGRTGKSGMVGGTLYTTTFPCHNCARHIVAAGIQKVYYVEPYAKSLAIDLHSDSISPTEGDTNKIAFLQYEGVGPESILKLFHHGIERKSDGKACEHDKKTAIPVLPPPMDGFTTHEKRVINHLVNVESTGYDDEPKRGS